MKTPLSFPQPPRRRLSYFRLFLVLAVAAGAIAGGVLGVNQLVANRHLASSGPWFAAYVDVTATPTYAFQQLGSTKNQDAVLSFVVSSPNDPCAPAWGAAYSLDQANASLSLDTRIARLQQQGGSVAISFGGRDNSELALTCTDTAKLLAAYQAVISRYNIDTIDLDIEEPSLGNAEANTRRAEAVANLQTNQRAKGKNLAVWLTLPVMPQGLSEDGTNIIAVMLKNHVDLAGVNVMTMDYGTAYNPDDQSMAHASETALTETHRQLGILYRQAGINLSDNSLWAKLGATPMIGQNDYQDEIFSIDDAAQLNSFVQDHRLGRVSMWSANRDISCGSNYVNIKVVSDSCSGVDQQGKSFADILSVGLTGNLKLSAGLVTSSDATQNTSQEADDPANSPYQIWSQTSAYLQGTKVVWHHNVYQAKWWTQGDVPDNPVLQTWQTPWELIGPVLPGDKPIQQPTLPAGTYPDWNGKSTYNTGDRILFSGVPYQAKWWNQGSSPAAASSSPATSPWAPLTQAQINDILAGKK